MKKKLLKITGNYLLSIKRSLRNFFSYERGPCKFMEELHFKSIPVNYPNAIINGTERKARVKIWNVAATTVHPTLTCRSHAEWMIEIQFAHADVHRIIGDYERMEVLQGLKSYASNVPLRAPIAVKNT